MDCFVDIKYWIVQSYVLSTTKFFLPGLLLLDIFSFLHLIYVNSFFSNLCCDLLRRVLYFSFAAHLSRKNINERYLTYNSLIFRSLLFFPLFLRSRYQTNLTSTRLLLPYHHRNLRHQIFYWKLKEFEAMNTIQNLPILILL